MMRLLLLAGLVMVAMLALPACGDGDDEAPASEAEVTRAEEVATPTETAMEEPAPAETMEEEADQCAGPTPENHEDVPRNCTLIILLWAGVEGRNPDWGSFNNQVPGQVGGFHTGPLQTMAEPLIMFNVLTGEHENWLAESWEYNDDLTELTMKLREGIYWQDGMPFTAEDVAFTFNLVRDHQDEMVHTAEIHLMDRAEALDDRTILFVLKQPSPSWWVTTLTSNHGVTEQIFPKHVWEGLDDVLTFPFYDPDKGWPFGTGPYKLAEASAEQKIFIRDDDWWAAKAGFKELPLVQKVVYLPTRDETVRAQLIITNQIDFATFMPVPNTLKVLEENEHVVTWSRRDPPYGYVDWCPMGLMVNNASDHPVAQSANIRHAIYAGINQEQLIDDAERGAGISAFHLITPYDWFQPFEQNLQALYEKHGIDNKAHPERTEQLMTEEGYEKDSEGFWVKDGERIHMNIPVVDFWAHFVPLVVEQLRGLGFEATMDQIPGLSAEFARGEIPFDWTCKGPSGVKHMDPYYMLSLYTSATFRAIGDPPINPWATARFRNAEFDAIVDQMVTLSPDDPETMELFVDAMDIWFRELPDLYMAQLVLRHLANEYYWTGWSTKEENLGFLDPWQLEFKKTLLNLKPTGRE
jgi:peptide/nickel transport system substrate-binding protein